MPPNLVSLYKSFSLSEKQPLSSQHTLGSVSCCPHEFQSQAAVGQWLQTQRLPVVVQTLWPSLSRNFQIPLVREKEGQRKKGGKKWDKDLVWGSTGAWSQERMNSRNAFSNKTDWLHEEAVLLGRKVWGIPAGSEWRFCWPRLMNTLSVWESEMSFMAHVVNACPIACGTLRQNSHCFLPSLLLPNYYGVSEWPKQTLIVHNLSRASPAVSEAHFSQGYCKPIVCVMGILSPLCSHALRHLSICSTHLPLQVLWKIRSPLPHCIACMASLPQRERKGLLSMPGCHSKGWWDRIKMIKIKIKNSI